MMFSTASVVLCCCCSCCFYCFSAFCKRISTIMIEREMLVKHQEQKKLKKEIKALSVQLKIALVILVHTTLLHQINIVVKSTTKFIAKTMEKNYLENLENVIKRVVSRVVYESVKMPYTIFCHARLIMTKFLHLIMDQINTCHIRRVIISSTHILSYFTKIIYAIYPIYLSKIWHIRKQNYEIPVKNIVKLKDLLNRRKLYKSC